MDKTRPLREETASDRELRWESATLPASVSEADLDSIIFFALTARLQKTAMVIVKAMKHCDEHTLSVSAEIIGARIQALAEACRIESVGDLRRWRYSEVRLQD